jgi:hypothetical protein
MPKKIIFSEQETSKIIELYQSRTSCKQIGKQFNCSKQTINALLREQDILLRDFSHCQQKYAINEDIFENINTPEKAYWLGMLTGDGWITDDNDIGLSLEQSDKEYVYKLREFLQSNHPITLKNNGLKNDGTFSMSYELRLTNKKIVSDLRKYGFHKDKTHYMDFPKLSKTLLCYYMLGLVDSDGSFCLKTHYKKPDVKLLNFNFIAPTEFAQTFQEILIDRCHISKTKLGSQKNTNFVKVVEYGGYKNIYQIVKFLYHDPPVWMERKKSIAINYLLTKYPNDEWLKERVSA